ncbi:MAG: NRDE family protein [Candidatus Poribacteria bacterium]|nr:NRDE family protein [Candidatus Poribacteria bacterium]MDP6748507.1 NRDE family protein [Candidatus Poribacteria bacterium]MDP6997365.1 NRDE family protein [Candidatus Poribacteria bacterium]
MILFAHRVHPRYPLILLANRDEVYARPTMPACFWPNAPDLLAGRDLVANGTWLGITKSGRWAAVSNFRHLKTDHPVVKSRGELVADFLTSTTPIDLYAKRQQAENHCYNGFNLLLGEVGSSQSSLTYLTNYNQQISTLPSGIYGVSNHLIDADWEKVVKGKQQLKTLIRDDVIKVNLLLEMMQQYGQVPEEALFITSDHYGTRSTTLILVEQTGRVLFLERTYDSEDLSTGLNYSDVNFQFQLSLA